MATLRLTSKYSGKVTEHELVLEDGKVWEGDQDAYVLAEAMYNAEQTAWFSVKGGAVCIKGLDDYLIEVLS